jgi:hypothetical protein
MSAPPPPQQRTRAFDERNVFTQSLLGLISTFARFDELLWEEPSPGASTIPSDAPPDERLVEAVLGIIAIRERITALLEVVAPEPLREVGPESDPPVCGPRPGPLREWLR